jgi:hypothetical protein
MIVEQYCKIEEALWQHGSQNKRSVASGLRHRYCLLHLTSGILRCESLYRAELSDFLGLLVPKKPIDPHNMWLMITQIPQGKQIMAASSTGEPQDTRMYSSVALVDCHFTWRIASG